MILLFSRFECDSGKLVGHGGRSEKGDQYVGN